MIGTFDKRSVRFPLIRLLLVVLGCLGMWLSDWPMIWMSSGDYRFVIAVSVVLGLIGYALWLLCSTIYEAYLEWEYNEKL
ncbi:MAG: hypothetical protein AAF402_07175 [Pseudomonadota bacterium]